MNNFGTGAEKVWRSVSTRLPRLRYSQLLCLRIEPAVLPFSKALLREYMRYATLASKLLRFALTQ